MNKKSIVFYAAFALAFAFYGAGCVNSKQTNESISAKKMSNTSNAEDLTSFTKTSTGLQFKDVVVGSGQKAEKSKVVKVHYTGTFYPSGEKFDSSLDRGKPFEFNLGQGQVIKGWDEGVQGMQIGGKRTLIIPPALGYGDYGVPGAIPPNSTLKFDVELLEVK